AERADRPERSLRLPVVVSVDEDGCGRVVVSSVQGRVARVVDGSISRCASSTVTPAVPAAPGCGLVADTASRRSRRGVIRDGILVRLSVRTRCALELRLRAGGASGPVHALKLLPGARRVVPLRVSVAVRHALRRRVTVRTLATSHGRSVRRTLTVRLRHGDL
ncbi:MAG: hypothetical protein QOI80_3362, partial [Solirubrobacteraceae bacterium]|nr:hypothetical protein [Solirubrobacteraceae bacterium]